MLDRPKVHSSMVDMNTSSTSTQSLLEKKLPTNTKPHFTSLPAPRPKLSLISRCVPLKL